MHQMAYRIGYDASDLLGNYFMIDLIIDKICVLKWGKPLKLTCVLLY